MISHLVSTFSHFATYQELVTLDSNYIENLIQANEHR